MRPQRRLAREKTMIARKRPRRGKIIVFGIAYWYPLAGVTYQFLHYLLGLRALGYDPYYVEDTMRWVYDPRINAPSPDASGNVAAVSAVLEAHGFAGRWAFRGNYPDGACYGMTEEELLSLYGEADAFLNVTGSHEVLEEHLVCPRRIYIESDPFMTEVEVALGNQGTIDRLAAHDTHFSFGENLGNPDCRVPAVLFRWLPTRQPVALDLWKTAAIPQGGHYTTVTNWHNETKDIAYGGETFYWTKDREFMKFIELPRRCSVPFELALREREEVQSLLHDHGWSQVDGVEISQSFLRYRSYIQHSRAEFTVARDQYVRPYTGWFSDRSACYLASGRPVITQDTGFGKFLPTGQGLFAFTTIDDILAAVQAVESDYEGNCRAAMEIAAEYFAAEKVVGSLMERAGL